MSGIEIAEDFIRLLKKSQLLSDSQIDEVVDEFEIGPADNPKQVAARFIKEDLITRFQAERILKGSARGLVIENYKLVEILGFGGMGVVYVAQELDSKWQVALKVLSEKYRDSAAVKSRFQLEAEAGMQLNHPNIVHTRAIKKTEDIYGEIHFVVMDLIKGVSLLELLLLKQSIPWTQACDIVCQAAKGLQHAHEAGLIHRDVKPDNLLIRSNGSVKVLDFGLAMLDENDEEFSMAMIHGQDCLGTADYVAPEQTINSYNVDVRADVYSLGCTLYAALTAKLPFPLKTAGEKIQAHRKLQPKPIREIVPEVPERVEKIVRKMMAKRPENRLQNMEDVQRYLAPLGVREEVQFDFSSILRWRARQARRKEKKYDSDKSGSPSAAMSSVDRETESSPERFDVDTIIGQDTQVQRTPEEEGETQ